MYYLAIKNEALVHATSWINLENSFQKEWRHHIVYDSIYTYEMSKVGKSVNKWLPSFWEREEKRGDING